MYDTNELSCLSVLRFNGAARSPSSSEWLPAIGLSRAKDVCGKSTWTSGMFTYGEVQRKCTKEHSRGQDIAVRVSQSGERAQAEKDRRTESYT
ncbi:hypothetical protein R3I94_001906 [Phoxinus phoxinus]|uniref:Uncharacterized protein n=1 Tax=Phoxinus phoxinus TaxID=58324 RepID=A0AAN9HJB7_9TELE